eukprot:2699022-Amphidinium_carterae.1
MGWYLVRFCPGDTQVEIHTTFNHIPRPRPTAFQNGNMGVSSTASDSDDDSGAVDGSALLAKNPIDSLMGSCGEDR